MVLPLDGKFMKPTPSSGKLFSFFGLTLVRHRTSFGFNSPRRAGVFEYHEDPKTVVINVLNHNIAVSDTESNYQE